MRMYRTVKGIWGFGFGSTYGHVHIQIGPWVFTTEPE